MNPTTNPRVIYIIIGTLAVMGLMGMFSLCLGLFVHIYADASLMSTVNTLTSGAAGALVGVLASIKTNPPGTNISQETKSETVIPQDPPK